MPFTVQIRNLGKLADASVRIGRLTVLAGPNNTGKSFFSKAMYSVFDAMNANPVEIAVNNELAPLRLTLTRLNRATKDWARLMAHKSDKEDAPAPSPLPHLTPMIESVARVASVAASCSLNGGANADEDVANFELPYPELEQAVADLEEVFGFFKPELEEWIRPNQNRVVFRRLLGGLSVGQIAEYVSSVRRVGEQNRSGLVINGISSKVSDEFSENFQIEDLTDLIGANGESAAVEIDGVASFSIGASANLGFELTHVGLLDLQRFSRVIYLESPVLWKLKTGLQILGRRGGWRLPELNEVPPAPGYFYDLVNALGTKYRGEEVARQEVQRLAKEVVRGKIVLNETTGELQFAEVGAPKPRSLSIVSTGVANVGFLAMLVEKKIVDKNSFLFIDEPEAHLHPGWQVEMTRLLFALALEGVHVVIATHSSDILERLSALVKKHPGSEEIVALNHFSRNGVNVGGDKEFRKQMGGILKELTEAFSDSYMMNQELLDQESS